MQPAFQHTTTHRRDGAVEHRSQRIFRTARQVLSNFQVTTCRGIHNDAVLLTFHGDRTNMRQSRALGIFRILQQTTGSTKSARRVLDAKTDQIAGAKLQIQLLARGVDFKLPQRATAQAATAFNQRHLGEIFCIQQFRRISALQLCRHRFAVGRFAQAKTPGADIQRRVAETFAVLPDSRQQVVLTLLQQGFIADGAWRNDTHNFALNRTFAGRRIANLFADGNGLSLIHQFGEIVFHRMVGNPRHRDRLSRRSTAFGQ